MFKKILFLLLISSSFITATAQPCSDTLLPNTAGYAALCCQSIGYTNTTIHIQATNPAQVADNLPCYRFILQDCDTAGLSHRTFPGYNVLNDSLLIKLPQQQLLVNNKPFTGSLRIAVRFYIRFAVPRPFAGHHLHIFYFKEGLYLRREIIPDVWLFHERPQVRPG